MRHAAALVCALFLSGALVAQTPPAALPAFEVASIKPADPKVLHASSGSPSPALWTATNFTLFMLIQRAYPEFAADAERIVGGPRWMRDVKFTVEAKAAAPPAPGALTAMIRQLLAERFALQVHRESRLHDVYVARLTRADGRPGPWLRPTAAECVAAREAGQPRPDVCRAIVREREATGQRALTLLDLAMPDLFAVFRDVGGFDRPIVDGTGLSGRYDVSVAYQNANVLDVTGTGVSLPAAAEDQLGVKFTPDRAPLDVLVIDSAAMPTPN